MTINQDMLDMAKQIREMAEEINEMARSISSGPGEWSRWFAWHPVKTIGGDRVWCKQIYRRTKNTIFQRYVGYDYATDFDILKND